MFRRLSPQLGDPTPSLCPHATLSSSTFLASGPSPAGSSVSWLQGHILEKVLLQPQRRVRPLLFAPLPWHLSFVALCLHGFIYLFIINRLACNPFPSGIVVKNRLPIGLDLWVRKIPWSRNWQPTIFLPGKFHGQRSLVGYRSWGHKESDTTEHSKHKL